MTSDAAKSGPLLPGVNLSDQAYSIIRARLINGSIPPGELITEGQIAGELDVSRTPVREALQRLQSERFLVAVPHKGYLVTDLSEAELRKVYDVRAMLESFAAARASVAARRTNIARMEDVLDDMSRALASADDERLVELNTALHLEIAQASQNEYLVDVLTDVGDIVQRFRRRAIQDNARRWQAHEEHRAIVEAIKSGAASEAAELSQRHIQAALALRVSQDIRRPADPDGPPAYLDVAVGNKTP
jgi:DNA-binding GntR family transcriptional regulator